MEDGDTMNATITIGPLDDPSPAPSIDLSLLQCYVVRTRTRTWLPATRESVPAPQPQLITKQVQCETRVVYRVFRANRPPLDMCNQHFNEYFERHNVGANMVVRLSDDEQDFVPAARRIVGKKKSNSNNVISIRA
jgi:hypothetical protein